MKFVSSPFCEDEFWNVNKTWNSNNPRFTECFQNVVTVIPTGILILIGIPWIIWIKRRPIRLVPQFEPSLPWFYIFRLALVLFLAVSIVVQIYLEIDRTESIHWSGVLHFSCAMFNIIFVLFLVAFEHRSSVTSSLVLTIFWPFYFIALFPSFLNIVQDFNDLELADSLPYLISMSLTFILVLTTFFADLHGFNLEKSNQSPQYLASYMSSFVFGWFEPLIYKGYKNILSPKDLPKSPDCVEVRDNVETFLYHWNKHVETNAIDFKVKGGHKTLTLWKPLFKAFGLRFVLGNILGLLNYTEVFAQPLILKLLINHVDNENEEAWKGYLYAAALFLVSVLNTILFNHNTAILLETSIRIKSALISAICRKSLKLSSSARQSFTSGEITNLVSVDCQRIADGMEYIGMLYGGPWQVIIGIILIYRELGTAALIGSLGMLILIPLNLIGGKIVEKLESRQLRAKDSRIKLMNEILNGIKVLKLYAWEIPFMKKINEIRTEEIDFLRINAWIFGVLNFTYCMSPFLVTIGSFSTYVLLDPENHILTPAKVFVCISLFNLLRLPLTLFPMTFKSAVDMIVSFRRIENYLNADELSSSKTYQKPKNSKVALEINKGTFSWEDWKNPQLKEINVRVEKGSLTAIVGVVGSGKSSVLQAILGEMDLVNGSIQRDGTISYVPQQAWIQNLTLQQNILFSKTFQQVRYDEVIEACALKTDFNLLSNGDQTEIGENGVNLSGGQKQRVALARAVYFDADICLLDDPLSAVDSHVGKHIFENVIDNKSGILEGKTKIWVTNQVSYLPNADQVIFLSDGRIVEKGSYKDLIDSKGALYDFVQQTMSNQQSKEDNDDTSNLPGTLKKQIMQEETMEVSGDHDGHIIEDETSLIGNVPLHVFKDFASKMGTKLFCIFLVTNVIEHALHAGGILWLSDWSDDSNINSTTANQDSTYRLGIYSALSIGEALLQFSRDVLFHMRCAVAAKYMHEALLKGVMKSPMSFFDTTPLGRIINRFSSDIDTMEMMIPTQMSDFVWCLCEIVATLIIIGYATPLFIAAMIPIGGVFIIIQRFYIVTARQLRRLFSISKSPVFSHFAEIVFGSKCIRAFTQNKRFVYENEEKLIENVKSGYLTILSNRWLSMRVENVANLMILFTALFCVIQRDSLQPGMAALAITYALNIIGSTVWTVRMACSLENNCVALERIFEYSKLTPEARWESDEPSKELKTWPSKGSIEFRQYQTRYREGLDLVLKGIDLTIEPQEKVGICGRTGAGKSSLTLSLFRIIEAVDGNVWIDGINVSKLGLHELRSKLAIIPQEPVLFTGTLRFNLDPVGEYSDKEIWNSLELSHLKSHINKNLPLGLENEVTEGGSNFSVGQRQLICLARALLRNAKILVLDEATAAVDPETDDLIQETIRKQFKECTVLTIAHRLNTILDSDKIVVLGKGKILEVDSPNDLLKDPNSHFHSMAIDAGII